MTDRQRQELLRQGVSYAEIAASERTENSDFRAIYQRPDRLASVLYSRHNQSPISGRAAKATCEGASEAARYCADRMREHYGTGEAQEDLQ